MFGGFPDDTVESVHVCDKDVVTLESFIYFGSVVHNRGGSCQEVLRWIGLAYTVMESPNTSIFSWPHL